MSVLNTQDTSRLALTQSIALRGSVNIDPYWRLTIDRAFANGHWYSDKAPGVALFAVPVYEVIRVEDAAHPPAHPTEVWNRKWHLWGIRVIVGGHRVPRADLPCRTGRGGLRDAGRSAGRSDVRPRHDGGLARADALRASPGRALPVRGVRDRVARAAAAGLGVGRPPGGSRCPVRVSSGPRRDPAPRLRRDPRRQAGRPLGARRRDTPGDRARRLRLAGVRRPVAALLPLHVERLHGRPDAGLLRHRHARPSMESGR